MTAEPTTDPATNRSRRDVLCGLVVALLAPGALATACGDLAPSGSGGTATTGGATGGGGSTGGGGTAGGTGGGAGGAALAALTDVPEGGGLIVDSPSGTLLLVRPSANEVKAYDPACTHEGTQVNPPRNGVIVCPNHGSQFDQTNGSVKRGPATAALKSVAVKVEAGSVVLA